MVTILWIGGCKTFHVVDEIVYEYKHCIVQGDASAHSLSLPLWHGEVWHTKLNWKHFDEISSISAPVCSSARRLCGGLLLFGVALDF